MSSVVSAAANTIAKSQLDIRRFVCIKFMLHTGNRKLLGISTETAERLAFSAHSLPP